MKSAAMKLKKARVKKLVRLPIEEFLALSDAERDRVAREFENPASAATFRPLNAREKQIWAKAKKRMGRPVKGKGARVISLSVEAGLLTKADRFAKKEGSPAPLWARLGRTR